MGTTSHFETLTIHHVLIQERTKQLISDLRGLVHLLDRNIQLAEKAQNSGIPNLDRLASARKLKGRKDALRATICRLRQR